MILALADLRFAKGRFALVGLVIGLVAVMATLLSGLANGLVDDGISGLRRLPLSHLAFQPGAHSTFSRSTLTTRNLSPWEAVPDVEVSALGVSFLNAKPDRGSTIDMALFGVPPGSFLAPQGMAEEALAGPAGIVLSDKFAGQGIEVGDMLTVIGTDTRLPVLGFTYAGSYGHVDIAFTSLRTWQELTYGPTGGDRFSAIALRASNTSGLAGADAAADTETVTKAAAYAGSPGYTGETQTMSLIRGFLVVISALIVGAFFTVWTVQRSRQIGVLKALGASNRYVVLDAVGQLAAVLVIAVGGGALVAVGLGQFVGDSVPFRLDLRGVVLTAVLLIVLGLAGTIVALRRVLRIDPIVALRAEV